MSGEWFHCSHCEIDFQDPLAPVQGDYAYGQCPECGSEIGRRTNEVLA